MLDTDNVHMRGGEFIANELQLAVDKDEITYSALWECVATLSQQLLQQVSPGERAVLCLESEAKYLIALLACFGARIIAVPSLTPSS